MTNGTRRFSLLALVVLVAVVALWVRSFRRVDALALFGRGGALQGIASDRGTLLLFFSSIPFGSDKAWGTQFYSVPAGEFRVLDSELYGQAALKWKFAGFKFSRDKLSPKVGTTWSYDAVTIPDWGIALAAFVPTARGVRGVWLRRRRRRRGLCLACGYDLRMSEGPCPECGTPAEQAGRDLTQEARPCA